MLHFCLCANSAAIAALLYLTAVFLPTAECDRTYGNHDVMNEAIARGKADLEEWRGRGSSKRACLCATFLSTDHVSFQTTLTNARVLKCDWAVIFYDMSDMPRKTTFCRQLGEVANVVYCEGAMVRYKASIYKRLHLTPEHIYNYSALRTLDATAEMTTVPKQAMYLDLLPLLPGYHRVVLIDSDMLFSDLKFDHAMRIWDCSFHPPPLIVHIAVVGKTLCREHRARWWRKVGNWTGTTSTELLLAAQITFIEQQAPFIHAGFFYWFLKSVLRKYTIVHHLETRNGWGTDSIWCGAARAFGRYVLGHENYSWPCAVITGAGPVHHESTMTINKSLEFRTSGVQMLHFHRPIFNRWCLNASNLNALIPSFRFSVCNYVVKKNLKAFSLIENCSEIGKELGMELL